MIEIDLRSRMPIYEQIIEAIKEQIITGELKANNQLPSVRELASKLAINPNTIQRSFRKLEEEGFIYSVRGRGSFVMELADDLIKEQKLNSLGHLKLSVLEAKKLDVDIEDILDIIHSIYKEGVKS